MTTLPKEPCERWRDREYHRFDHGLYIKPIWWGQLCNAATDCHFAHHSLEKDCFVSFTPDETFGKADRQLRMKPGRYLKKYFPDLSDEEIRSWALEFEDQVKKAELLFASTREDIRWVYENGPRSCMKGVPDEFDVSYNNCGDVHPCEIYAAGDLAVAYIKSSSVEDKVTARTLCWPEKKIFSRTYGDEHRLKVALEDAGYEYDPAQLVGAKLLRIRCGSGFVAPYIDHYPDLKDTGTHLVITNGSGHYCVDNTDGSVGCDTQECEHCGCTIYDGDDTYEVQGNTWCESCYENESFYCECCNEQHNNNNARSTIDGEVCRWCRQEYYTCCEDCDEYFHNDDIIWHDGDPYCQSCFDEKFSFCEGCGDTFNKDDLDENGRCKACAEAASCQVAAE